MSKLQIKLPHEQRTYRLEDLEELDTFQLDLTQSGARINMSYDASHVWVVLNDEPSPSGKQYLANRTLKQRYVLNLNTGKISCRALYTAVIPMKCTLTARRDNDV